MSIPKKALVFLVFLGFGAQVLLGSQVFAASAPKPFQLAFQMGKQGYLDAEIKRMLEVFLAELEKTAGIKVDLAFFRDPEPFFQGVKTKNFDMIFTMDETDRLLTEPFGYKPFVAMSIFGKAFHPACFYVGAQAPGKTVDDFKMKRLGLLDYKAAYYQLREALKKDKPEKFFQIQKPAVSGQSALYQLSLGQSDIVFVYAFNVGFLKALNPGPLKKIRELSCAPTQLPTPPIFIRPDLPVNVVNALENMVEHLETNPAFARFRMTMQRFGIKWVKVDPAVYQKVGKWLVDGKKKGWDRDFQTMLLYAGKQ